jgi:aminoglycoside phosphotransferase (APT) family kinase protein
MMAIEIDLEITQDRLKTWFEKQMPQAVEFSVVLDRDKVGGSNETFFLDLLYREAGQGKVEKLVIRWPPQGFTTLLKYDMKEQFLLFKKLRETALPVPEARWLEEDESVIGRPFYIVDRISGWIPGAHPTYSVAGPIYEGTPQYRAKVWWNAVEALSIINTIDWERLGFDFLDIPKGGSGPIDQHIACYEKMLRVTEKSPPKILVSTLEWLKKNRFEPKCVSLCWGDARLGNLIYRDHTVVGVLDWEMACLGDPESDLAWFLNMDVTQHYLFAKGEERLEGLPGREETLERYENLTNRRLENFFYHEVFAIWRLAVICLRLRVFLKAIGYPLPDMDMNEYNFERLRTLLGLSSS